MCRKGEAGSLGSLLNCLTPGVDRRPWRHHWPAMTSYEYEYGIQNFGQKKTFNRDFLCRAMAPFESRYIVVAQNETKRKKGFPAPLRWRRLDVIW